MSVNLFIANLPRHLALWTYSSLESVFSFLSLVAVSFMALGENVFCWGLLPLNPGLVAITLIIMHIWCMNTVCEARHKTLKTAANNHCLF